MAEVAFDINDLPAGSEVQIACRTMRKMAFLNLEQLPLAAKLTPDKWRLFPICPYCGSERHCLIRLATNGQKQLASELFDIACGDILH